MKAFMTFLIVVALVIGASVPIQAQTATTQTALATALASGSQNTLVCLVSVTGITASTASQQTFIYVDNELMQVRAVNTTSKCVTVRRDAKGFAPGHIINEPVFFGGPATFDPGSGNIGGPGATPTVGGSIIPPVFVGSSPIGTCTRASNAYLPVINPGTGDIFDCILSLNNGTTTQNSWYVVNTKQYANARPYTKLKNACAAGDRCTTYTAQATDDIIGYNTTGNGFITLPSLTGWVGKQYKIQIEQTGTQTVTIQPPSGFTINATNAIAIGGSTNFGGVDIYYDGLNYFATRAH